MDSLYLLVPMSVLLVLALMGLFAWALHANQFDDLQREGERILEPDDSQFDPDQVQPRTPPRHSRAPSDEEMR